MFTRIVPAACGVVGILIFAGCGGQDATDTPAADEQSESGSYEQVEEALEDVAEEAAEAGEVTKEAAMEKRDEYAAKMKAKLDQANAQISQWEAQLAETSVEAESKLSTMVDTLKTERDEFKAQLDMVQNASADAWEDLKTGVDKAATDLSAAIEKAKQNFTEKSST